MKSLHKKIRIVFLFLIGLAFGYHFFFEHPADYGTRDDKLHTLLSLQRKIDWYAPLSTSHLQGTHNSYNSDAYHTLLRYHDRQQRFSIGQQLDSDARFIELDTHWTFSAHEMKQDFLLCHGSSKFSVFPFHWGCSPYDLPLKDVLMEISEWIQQEKNAQEVMILYIEDHSEAHHEELYQLLGETHLLERIFPSGGCIAIPDDLTKADVLAAGKQIILWKDELRLGQKNIPCGDNKNIAELAFNDLGNLKRKAEDRTFLGSIDKRLRHGTWPRILLDDVKPHLLDGVNIMNLDEFVQNDERLYEFLWTWSLDADINLENACTIMQSGGSWLFRDCNERHHAACVNTTFTEWKVSQEAMTFDQASKSCESESADVRFHFSAPTNFSENLNLLHTMEARKYNRLWLNIRYTDNDVQVGDKRSENSITGN